MSQGDIRQMPIRLHFAHSPWWNRFGCSCKQGLTCWLRPCIGRWLHPGVSLRFRVTRGNDRVGAGAFDLQHGKSHASGVTQLNVAAGKHDVGGDFQRPAVLNATPVHPYMTCMETHAISINFKHTWKNRNFSVSKSNLASQNLYKHHYHDAYEK